MIICKFGGTSVGSAERMKQVAELVKGGEKKIVVLSAMAGTTNALVEIANYLFKNQQEIAANLIQGLRSQYKKTVKELFSSDDYRKQANELLASHFDYLISFTQDSFTVHEEKAVLAQGELLSTAIFQLYCEEAEIESKLLPALQFMRIDKDLEPDDFYIKENLNRLLADSPDCPLFITQGYICRNRYGEIDNLKRGGSDYSASLIGVAGSANEVQIWTDIDGMHNNDPRIVKETQPIQHLSYEEAAELAYFGAKILHPSSITPTKAANIPVRLKSTMSPEADGTLITSKTQGKGIKAIAAKDGITAIKVKSGRMLLAFGFLRKVFEIFELYRTSIDMITTSEVAVSVTIDDTTHLKEISKELEKYGTVEVDKDQTIVCVVGDFIKKDKGVAKRVFDCLSETPLSMISYGGSDHNISLLVNTKHKAKALEELNRLFQ